MNNDVLVKWSWADYSGFGRLPFSNARQEKKVTSLSTTLLGNRLLIFQLGLPYEYG
jgi:hypothetical protein